MVFLLRLGRVIMEKRGLPIRERGDEEEANAA
jgi:hypothetical protein